VEQVENKRDDIKSEKELLKREQYTLRPKVDRLSTKMVLNSKENQEPAYERLHKIHQMKLLKQKKEPQMEL